MLRIAIIGSGFSGLCLGIQLKKAGFHAFTIFEKSSRLGGTWRENTYPGAACDVPSFSYCFSFEQKTDWSRKWSPQAEILAYMDHCAEKYGLLPHLRVDTEITAAHFDGEADVWRLRTARGEEITAEILVSGVGQLNRPYTPALPGMESFDGVTFHSARWNHGFDLQGKDVAVIGNAASAIQFIPQIAPVVRTLDIYQRSANWMLPRGDRAFRAWERALFRRLPPLARLYRWWTWLLLESTFYPVIRRHPGVSRRAMARALENLRTHIADPRLRVALVPDYPIGGKRVLISDDYYPALTRENVHVVTAGIDRVERDGIATRDGTTRHADCIIFATGFETTAFLAPMHVEGPGGRSLEAAWKTGAEAYLGISVAGFPNFFMMYGPNTNLGHNSIIFMIECQVRYIIDCLTRMERDGLSSIDVRPEAMAAYNAAIQQRLAGSAWAQTDHSWYKNAAGRITNNWAGTTIEYWWRTRRADLSVYRRRVRGAQATVPVRSAA